MASTSSTSTRRRASSATPRSSSRNLAADGRTILFVGTKRQAQDVIAEEAQRCGMFYINQRWLGGLLTNFTTIQRSLGRLRDLEAMVTDGRYDSLSKKEIAGNEKEKRKLSRTSKASATCRACPTRSSSSTRQGEDCRRRGAQAEDPGHRHRRHQLRSRPGGLRHSRQRRRAARRSGCSRRRLPRPSSPAAACANRAWPRKPRRERRGRGERPTRAARRSRATDRSAASDATPAGRDSAGSRHR